MAYVGQGIKGGTFSVLDTSGNTYNGSNTTFNLGTHVSSPAQLLVSHDGVIQKPVTDYTLATGGTQITFTTAPASGASIFITEISGAVGAPMNRDINGDELILDADADTSITADTDDQIDIRIAGNDDFKLTAKTLSIGGAAAADTMVVFDGNAVDYRLGIDDSADTFEIGIGSTHATTPQMTFSSSGIVVNEGSADYDFRVESNGNANMLFISGGNDVVGIGSEGDLGRGLHIKTSDTGGSVATNATDLVIERAGDNGMTFMNNDSGETFINFGDDGDNDIGQIRYHHAYNRMQLHTNAVERLRIASDGEVSVNDGQVDTNGTVFKAKGAVDETTCKFYHGSTSGNQNLFVFYDGAAENCGSISINTASNTVAYNTSSDYRLKENETAITDGITRLKQLKPYRFNWKADKDGDKVDGFFAHEVSSIVPEAIFGTKDAMTTDDDGKTVINPQQIDQSKLVPLLTAAIIELEARVKTLEG
jgi:hypothetical protein